MADILLTNGMVTIVDDKFEFLKQFKWRWGGKYVERTTLKYEGKRTTIRLHQEILKPIKGFEIDHKDGNTLDNRETNLRVCSRSQNMMNRPWQRNNKLGLKGVRRMTDHRRFKPYQARIKIGERQASLGYFVNPIEAARAYDKAALEGFGEFARLNYG